MVVFTCSHCGDSLQKPRVQKHYDTKCKNYPIALTCVDCLKDFRLEEYVEHTKCVTEEQRYSKKGTVLNVKKGEEKQTSWVVIVNELIAECKNPKIRNLLDVIAKYANIPRKQQRFINFAKSIFHNKVSDDNLLKVWKLLEQRLELLKPQNKSVNEEQSPKKKENGAESKDISECEERPKKKKRKAEGVNNKSSATVDDTETPKKKKKNSVAIKTTLESKDELIQNTTDSITTESRKKKKTKNTCEVNTIKNSNCEITKKKKVKTNKKTESKSKDSLAIKTDKDSKLNGNSKKSMKSKKKLNSNSTEGSLDDVSGNVVSEQQELQTEKKDKFLWKKMIKKILSKNPKGLSKPKLWKKLSKTYETTQGAIANEEKLLHIFNINFKKMLNSTLNLDKTSQLVTLIKI